MDRELKSLLIKYGFSFKKAYGQNFLTDSSLLSSIVEEAGVSENDVVLEIGCGAGALTKELCKKAKFVYGYEIDKNLTPVLKEVLKDFNNVSIEFKDVLKENPSSLEEKIGKNYIMVANLPYYITTPIIMQFLEKAKNLKAMVIMVQEEVAYRLCASPATSDYGAITVAINLRGKGEIIKRVPRGMFTPSPNVDSAVVKIGIDKEKYLGVDLDAVREVVRVGFSSRRKMLVNNLMNFFKLSRAQAELALENANIDKTLRGEALSELDYINLANAIKELKK